MAHPVSSPLSGDVPARNRLPVRFGGQLILLFSLLLLLGACGRTASDGLPPGDPDNVGLLLPDGFEALVVVDSLGRSRHMAVNDNGDIYVNIRRNRNGTAALRDTTGDGRADLIRTFGNYHEEGGGTGIAIHNGYLYSSNAGAIYRFRLTPGELVPDSEMETLMHYDFRNAPHGFEHTAKPMVFDGRGNMYVAFGSPSDTCQELNRIPGSPGQDPCPELDEHAGIWVFDEAGQNQDRYEAWRYATGIRSVTAIAWNHADDHLYVVQHGRDYLDRAWPQFYDSWDQAVLPSEQFMRVTEGSDFGWPYCYHDQIQDRKLLNPEYGGDGTIVGRCSEFEDPLFGFPGHFAPNDLLFYTGDQFPERYRNGAFVAMHGSTDRGGYPQAGYFVAFVPFVDGEPGEWEVFANGFAGHDPLINQSDAKHRPMGLAEGPDGSLYIVDSVQGRIWRVMFKGDRDRFGDAQLARMDEEKRSASNVRDPEPEVDLLTRRDSFESLGEQTYMTYCSACHGTEGRGAYPRWPPIRGVESVTGDKEWLISVIVDGLERPADERAYDSTMPGHEFLSDEEVAAVATYIRQNFRNEGSEISTEEVEEFRRNR